MKRIALLLPALLLLFTFVITAQESEIAPEQIETPKEEEVIVVDLGVGFPTTLAVGLYWPNTFFELPGGILSGIEFTVGGGLGLNAPALFAFPNQRGLVGSTGMKDYYVFPADGIGATSNFAWGVRSYLRIYTLDLGFATLPLSTGFYIGGGSLTGAQDASYGYLDMMFGVKAEARLEAFKLLKPYLELGIGGGNAWPNNDAGRMVLNGYTSIPNTSSYQIDSDDYAKWYNAKWEYTHLLLNVGARLEIPAFWKNIKKRAPKVEVEPEPVDTRVSAFLFPKWLVDMGGLAVFPDGMMGGSVIIGPQNMFGKYSFKHQSSLKDNKFNNTYKPEHIVEIIQSDEEIYHVKLKNAEGAEIEYKLYRLTNGESIAIDGKTIEPVSDGVYFDGQVYETIRSSNM